MYLPRDNTMDIDDRITRKLRFSVNCRFSQSKIFDFKLRSTANVPAFECVL